MRRSSAVLARLDGLLLGARACACDASILGTLTLMTASCGLPRDAEHTLEHVRGGTLRVGVSEYAPWVEIDDARGVSGVEPTLVTALAKSLGATVSYRRGSQDALLHALHERELDLVAAGLHSDSPWAKEVALTKPYLVDGRTKTKHVLAVPAGENAWLMHVERFLLSHGQTP